jgi:hypothetical protein
VEGYADRPAHRETSVAQLPFQRVRRRPHAGAGALRRVAAPVVRRRTRVVAGPPRAAGGGKPPQTPPDKNREAPRRGGAGPTEGPGGEAWRSELAGGEGGRRRGPQDARPRRRSISGNHLSWPRQIAGGMGQAFGGRPPPHLSESRAGRAQAIPPDRIRLARGEIGLNKIFPSLPAEARSAECR